MRERGERGSIVSLLCDRGERYNETLFDAAWLAQHDVDRMAAERALRACMVDGHCHLQS